MQCYCGAGEDHLPFLYREFSDKREVRLFLFWESVVQAEYLFVDVEGFLRKNCESAVQAEKMLRRINL